MSYLWIAQIEEKYNLLLVPTEDTVTVFIKIKACGAEVIRKFVS